MWGSIRFDSCADSRWRPSIRSPVPQSRITRAPAGVVSSRQAVFPPYRQEALSTVGVEPRTPQNQSVATGSETLRRDGLALGSARSGFGACGTAVIEIELSSKRI